PGALVEYRPADDHQVEHGAVESCPAEGSAQGVMQLAHGHRLAGVPPRSPEPGDDVSVPGSEIGGSEQEVGLAGTADGQLVGHAPHGADVAHERYPVVWVPGSAGHVFDDRF